MEIVYTGSLQPYSHAEDPDGTRYVTVEGVEALAELGDATHGLCIRLRLERGTDVPPVPDCLQFQLEWIDEVAAPRAELDFESFSVTNLLEESMKERKIGAEVHGLVINQYEEIAR